MKEPQTVNFDSKKTKDTIYSTTDFYTTAMLISQNFEVMNVTKEGSEGKVKRFHFKKTEEVDDVILRYVNGNLEGSIRDFKNAIECVKDMVYTSN